MRLLTNLVEWRGAWIVLILELVDVSERISHNLFIEFNNFLFVSSSHSQSRATVLLQIMHNKLFFLDLLAL